MGHVGPGLISPARMGLALLLSCAPPPYLLSERDLQVVDFHRIHPTNYHSSWPSHAKGEGQVEAPPSLVYFSILTKTSATAGTRPVHRSNSTLGEAKNSANVICRGGYSEGTHPSSFRISPLHIFE